MAVCALAVLLAAGCRLGEEKGSNGGADSLITPTTYGRDDTLSRAELERGRMDAGWREGLQLDPPFEIDTAANREAWEQITPEGVNGGTMHLPLAGDVAGPSVLRAQILLDRARFSPGQIDGRWGKNTEKAIYWLQKRERLRANGQLDSTTFRRLFELAGGPDSLVTTYRITPQDAAGPFVEIPEDVYEQAELDCLCYESLREKLAEQFHASPELLARLNPDVSLDDLKPGDAIRVPNVQDGEGAVPGTVARIEVSARSHYVHALDAQNRIVFHFPSTLGSQYDPSPTGRFQIRAIAQDPRWHYQPELLADVDDSEEDAFIPPGPNNAVGVVWMDLTKEHYGIHGTSAPESIGYATSHGCVRLTNWDARFLSRRVQPGTPVVFTGAGTSGRSSPAAGGADPTGGRAAAAR